MTDPRTRRERLGSRAEALVCERLESRGFRILGRNVRVGPKELDIIACRGDLLVFCEVRARSTARFLSPLATLDARKIRNVREAARRWLYENAQPRRAIRFDVAAVVFDAPPAERIDYVENAF